MAVTLGKDVTVTGVANARSITINNAGNEVDCTAFSDGATGFRKYKKALIEQTVEVECVDEPGVSIGGTFTLTHTGLSTASGIEFVVTNIGRSDPIDGIQTFTVSASRHKTQT
jgi:hypothetical protein